MSVLKSVAAAALLALALPAAQAADCVGALAGTATTADVTFEGQASNSCQVVVGNPQAGPDGNASLFDLLGSGWTLLGKVTDLGASSTSNIGFSINPESMLSGSWTLVNDSSTGVATDVLFAMHAGKVAAGFFFDNVMVDNVAGTSTWTINWLNNGGNPAAYSNLTVFTRPGEGGGTIVTQPVPEPATYAMLALGLGFAAFAARRRAGR